MTTFGETLNILKKNEKRTHRFVYGDYVSNFKELCLIYTCKIHMSSQRVRRIRAMDLETFKRVHNEEPVLTLSCYFQTKLRTVGPFHNRYA